MKIIKATLSAICLLAILFISSCTEELQVADKFEPVKNGRAVQGDVDFNIFSRYEAALEDATYTRIDFEDYRKDDLTGGLWELITEDYIGASPAVPTSLVVRNGKIWKPIELFHCATGPTAFAVALDMVNIKLKKDYYVYAGRPFTVDTENYTLTLDDYVYGIALADDETLVLSFESEYWGGRTGNGGRNLEFGFYSKTEPLTFKDGRDLGFDSVVEAYDWLIDLFRATFGEEVNRNEIYYPNIIFDYPYFNVAALEAERDSLAHNE